MSTDTPNAPTKRRKLFIKTYGCQMNVYDSKRMADVLAPQGFETTDTPDDADMVILNTCHIREKAADKVYSDLGRMRAFKEDAKAKGNDVMIAVAGCVAQAEGAEIATRAPYVDLVLGPQTYHRLPELVARANRAAVKGNGYRVPVIDTEFPAEPKFDFLPAPRAEGPTAFLSIQEGCDKFCTYCVVPYTRGAEYSRPVVDVMREAKGLVAAGVREITLLGQNVNAFHGEAAGGSNWGLGRLVRELANIDGLARIRYTTSHPSDMDDDLIAAHGDVPALMPMLHLPVQSGADRILHEMNRNHTRDDYRRVIDRLRHHRADLALSSDFIVGFPGETDAEFQATMDLVREITFVQSYSFKYSKRPGTPASAMKGQVPDNVSSARLTELQALLDEQLRAFNASCLGKEMDVLITNPARHAGQMGGRSPYLQAVHVNAPASMLGQIVPVRITTLESYSLGAELSGAKAA